MTDQPQHRALGDLAHSRAIVFFGGSFDPPQLAHVALARHARDYVAPDAPLVFVPAGRSPMKDDARASGEHRAAMLALAIRNIPNALVWREELDRRHDTLQPTWWIDTLRAARAILGDRPQLLFIIGADQALAFHHWRQPRDILRLADPVVLPRGDVRTGEVLQSRLRDLGYWSEPELARWRDAMIPASVERVSSTLARDALADRDWRAAESLIDPAVLDYIRQHGLYAVNEAGA